MLSALFVYLLFAGGCLIGLMRPWIGLIVFYVFVVLEPTWNWRWAIDPYFPYQKYLAATTLIGFCLSGFHRNKLSQRMLAVMIMMLSFLALAFVSALQSINQEYSYEYLDVIWKIVLMLFLTVWLLDTPEKIQTMVWATVICNGYNAFQINLQYFQDGYSLYAQTAWGVKGDNNLYSIFSLPIMALSLSLAGCAKKSWQSILASSVFILQMHMLMLLESRGSMIGGLFFSLLFFYFTPKSKRIWGMMACGGLIAALLAGPSVVREFSSSFNDELDSSAASRFEVWRAGMSITADHPLLGVGPNAGRFLVPAFVPSEERDQKALHNLFFEISTGCGIPATTFYFGFFMIVWWSCVRLMKQKYSLPDWFLPVALAVACGIPGYMLASMFSSGAVLESSYLLTGLGVASILVHSASLTSRDDKGESDG